MVSLHKIRDACAHVIFHHLVVRCVNPKRREAVAWTLEGSHQEIEGFWCTKLLDWVGVKVYLIISCIWWCYAVLEIHIMIFSATYSYLRIASLFVEDNSGNLKNLLHVTAFTFCSSNFNYKIMLFYFSYFFFPNTCILFFILVIHFYDLI